MTNLLTSLLILLVVAPISSDTDKDKKKGKDQYYKYEREDVSVFREPVNFVLPDPVPVQFAGQEEDQAVFVTPQDISPKFYGGTRVVVEASPSLEALVNRDKYLKKQIESLPGYRIHIYAGTGRQQAWDAKRRALGAFPEIPSYLDYTVPNYVVRLGDFLDRDEAYSFLREARRFFPGAFLVSADVKVPKPSSYIND